MERVVGGASLVLGVVGGFLLDLGPQVLEVTA